MIKISNMSYHIADKPILNQLNVSFNDGFNVLLGPNGAGKSTLVALLTHLCLPSSGTIEYHGVDLHLKPHDAMAKIGVVFQQPTLDLDLTVAQNLAYHGSLHGISRRQVMINAQPLLAGLDLLNRLNDRVRQLNGGHRRRVELVRALVHQPTILLLDEASVGLDNRSRMQILSYIRQLTTREHLCVIWATHLLDEIDNSDNLVVLDTGRVVAHGEASALKATHNVTRMSDLYMLLTNQGALNAI